MKKKTSDKKTRKKETSPFKKRGIVFFIICNVSLAFLLISPYIPNIFGEWLDEIYFEEAQERIQEVRKGPIKIYVRYANGTPIEGASVFYNQTSHDFLFGALFSNYNRFYANRGYDPSANITFANLFNKIFNFATLAFYWAAWESEDDTTHELRINETIDFCIANNITTKGHPLVWFHEAGIPEWLNWDSQTIDEKMNTFKSHIKETVSKYSGIIEFWDVTNEIAHRPFPELNTEIITDSAFRWAHEADPNATLIINDYAILGHDFGYGPTAQFYDRLNALNTPYDAIGMQEHAFETDWIPTYEIWNTMEGYSRLGKTIHMTEVWKPSVAVPITNSWKKGLWSEENQAEYVRRFYTTVFSHPSAEAITWWGFRDGGYRMRDPEENDGLGLIRQDFTPKPAYEVLDNLINDEWHTQGTLVTNNAGLIEFSGFYGVYNLTISSNVRQIHAKKDGPNEFNVTI